LDENAKTKMDFEKLLNENIGEKETICRDY